MNDVNFLQVQSEPPSRKCPTCDGSGYVRPAMRQDVPAQNCFHYYLMDSAGNMHCQKCGDTVTSKPWIHTDVGTAGGNYP